MTQSGPGNGLHDDARPETGGQVQDKAQEVAFQAQEKAQEVAGQAKGRAQQMVDERSTQAGQQVSRHAGELRSVGDALRQQGQAAPARIADQAAERAERIGSYLSQSDGDRILRDVEDLARKNPWAVALGGLAVGFAASRFLKASSRERYSGQAATPRPQPTRAPTPTPPPVAPDPVPSYSAERGIAVPDPAATGSV